MKKKSATPSFDEGAPITQATLTKHAGAWHRQTTKALPEWAGEAKAAG